jgi:hypothetical protein
MFTTRLKKAAQIQKHHLHYQWLLSLCFTYSHQFSHLVQHPFHHDIAQHFLMYEMEI